MAISKEYLEKRTELIDEILATRTDVVKAIWTTLVATNDELKSHIALYDTLDTINSSVIYTQDEKIKLAGIEDGAQVNKIEKIFYNGAELKINTADKSVSFEAEKLNDAGSGVNPIYIENGKAAASTATAGGGLNPIFLNNGVLTASTATAGDINHGVYLENGVFKATTEARLNDAGSGVNPIYTTGGKITASTSSVGDADTPIYLKSGVLTATTSTIGNTKKPIWMNGGNLTTLSETIGSGAKPIYLNAGELTASTSTIGSATKPIYLNGGELTASNSSVGSATQPIYLSGGEFKAGNSGAIFHKIYTLSEYDSTQVMFNAIMNEKPVYATIIVDNKDKWLAGGTFSASPGGESSDGTKNLYIWAQVGFTLAEITNCPSFYMKYANIQIWGTGNIFPIYLVISEEAHITMDHQLSLFLRAAINVNDAKDPRIYLYSKASYAASARSVYLYIPTSVYFSFETTGNVTTNFYGVANSATATLQDETTLCFNGSRANLTRVTPKNKIKLGVLNGGEVIVNTNSNWILQQAANTRTSSGVIWQY